MVDERPRERPLPQCKTLSAEEREHYHTLITELIVRRKSLGLSQAVLDEHIGVSEGMVAKWEAGHRLPGAFFLMCWCKSLGARLTLTGPAPYAKAS